MDRLVRASLRKYSVPITAFISNAVIMEDTCLGVSFDHVQQYDTYRTVDGAIPQTGKIRRTWKEGRFWCLQAQKGNYVIGNFKREVGRTSFNLLRSCELV